jgi:hypothetical protein
MLMFSVGVPQLENMNIWESFIVICKLMHNIYSALFNSVCKTMVEPETSFLVLQGF